MAKTVAEEYAELYHYTNAEGLHGIITEQCLRATNIAFLNDAEERIHYFEKQMPLVLDRAIRSVFDEQSKVPEYQANIEQNWGYEKVVTDLKNGIIFKDGDQPFVVVKYSHVKMSRGSAQVKVKAKNILFSTLISASTGFSKNTPCFLS